jgi:hypothetical protein
MSSVKHISLSLLALMVFTITLQAQTIRKQEIGVLLATNGLGLTYNHALDQHWGISSSFSTLRHSKETRVQNPAFVNPKPYVLGKLRSAATLGVQLERIVTFSELTRHSPSISFAVKAGPSIAFLKPYYVYVQEMDNPRFSPRLTKQTVDLVKHQEHILGAADRFKGMDELSTELGLELSFEVRSDWQRGFRTQGMALGTNIKLFATDLNMMYANTSQFFASIYVNYSISTKSK